MPRAIKAFFNLIFIFLISISAIIVYSENSEDLKTKITSLVQSEIKKSFDVNASIKSLDVKWVGFEPVIQMKNIYMSDEKDRILLEVPNSRIYINAFNSLQNQSVSIDKIVINNTKLDLRYGKNKILLNKKNLSVEPDSVIKTNIPEIILNNSDIRITEISSNQKLLFKAKSLFASYRNNIIKVHSNFIHQASPNPITLVYRGEFKDDKVESKVFISGNSMKIPYSILPNQMQNLKSNKISLRVWLNLLDTKITRASGNISTDRLSMNVGESVLTLENINSDILFVKNNKSETLSLMRMNYVINNEKISNNKIVLSKDDKKNIKIFIRKNGNKVVKEFLPVFGVKKSDFLAQLTSSNIKNIQVHLNNRRSLDYFSLSLVDSSIQLDDKYSLNNINARLYGTLSSGLINIDNLSISQEDRNLLNKVSGKISYISKGKSIYFSSSNFSNDQNYNLSFSGYKTSKLPSIKLAVSSKIAKLVPPLSINLINNVDYDGKVSIKVYYHRGVVFTESVIEDVYINESDTIYLSSPKINLYSSSNFISSNNFNLSVNDMSFKSRIMTRSSSTSHSFILSSTGFFNTDALGTYFDMRKLIQGKTKIKSVMTYDYSKNKISSYVTSDLSGVTLNFIEPFNKISDDKKNFSFRYQHYPHVSYPMSVNLEEHEFKFKNDKGFIYTNISSPIARGFLKIPQDLNSTNTTTGSFEFIDTRFIRSDGVRESTPKINIKSKHVKTSRAVLDNVHIILSPQDDYISIDKLSFNNLNLEMQSSGKWFTDKNEKTEILADIKSDDLGQALTGLGYPGALKGGDLDAKLKAEWQGSLVNFSFSNATGDLNFTIKNGQINELDKGTQAIGQVLGLFSISSIPKRLSLDFSDFFSKGLRFDNLQSNVSLGNGVADTKKMTILGSFGEMRLSGKSNLVNKTHDQTLLFIPDLSSTSLVTGAVLGGPIGAAASIFYDKLLKEFGLDTNKLAGIEYSIKGPWKNPKIRVTQSFKPVLN
jgi:uncharacterized protein YhdP